MQKELVVEEMEAGQRLDAFLAQKFSDSHSRSQFKKIIELGDVRISGRAVTAHYKVHAGDKIQIQWSVEETDETGAEDIPLEIIFEDKDLLLVNKPVGMVVHPGHGNWNHTLVNALLFHARGLSSLGGEGRPGIVHRLDKDTSGIMLVAKNDVAHAFLAKQFKQHTIERTYRVIVKGVVQHEEGICEEPVGRAFLNRKKIVIKPSGGRDAVTYFRVIRRFSKATLLEVRPHTGRTHQIRVHMKHMDHPVLGDALYGVASPWISRQCVHAYGLRFLHPRTKKEVYYECTMPRDMQDLLDRLESEG